MCCPLVFEFSVGIGGFVIGPGSDLLLFLLLSNFLILHVWLRITDKGSVPEMRIWSISLI